jgi:tellurite resistance protein TerC
VHTLLPFNAFVILLITIDLILLRGKHRGVSTRWALWTSAVWIALALLFNVGIYFVSGKERALEFLAAYLVEKLVSIDNVFVFLIIFTHFRVPAECVERVNFWGSLSALIMRLVFIVAGVALLERFYWSIYPFGASLILSGVWLAYRKDREIHLESTLLIRVATKLFPVTTKYEGVRFFVQQFGRLAATPLLLVLLLVGTADVIFGVDSAPAILALSHDSFIIYASNVFAILGFGWLYFAVAEIAQMFHLIHYGLSAVLVFLGAKMILADTYKVPPGLSFAVIVVVLGFCIVASLIWPRAVPKSSLQRSTGTKRNVS